jgi:hypothetical protein
VQPSQLSQSFFPNLHVLPLHPALFLLFLLLFTRTCLRDVSQADAGLVTPSFWEGEVQVDRLYAEEDEGDERGESVDVKDWLRAFIGAVGRRCGR